MATFIVTTLADDNDGETIGGPFTNGLSLREAIALANGNADADTITFDASLSGGTIVLEQALGQLVATDALTINGDIDGDHRPDMTIDAQGHSRVLTTSASTTLQGLEITGGHTSGVGERGGGVHATGSTTVLTVIDSVVSGNSTSGSVARGGGISAVNNITISNSTIDANFTTGYFAYGGGVFSSSGSVTLTNTTISGNSTAGIGSYGGGIYAYNGVTAINSTITGNSTAGNGSNGGGIYNSFGTVVLTNSLVLGNVTSYAGLGEDEIHGTVTNNHSIVGGDASLIFAQTAEVLDGNNTATGVFAGVLADNGGPVQTIALKADPSNPALDASGAGATAQDARGFLVQDFSTIANTNGNARDLGAFELQLAEAETRSLVVTTLDDVVDAFDGETSLREAMAFANDTAAGDLADGDADNDGNANDTITFDAALSGGTILLTNGQLVAAAALTINGDIDGDHAPDITIDAQGNSRVLTTSASTTLQGLEITGGHTSGYGQRGGGVHATGYTTVLTVIDSVVSGNSTSGNGARGGGIYANRNITISNSTIDANFTTGFLAGGGGVTSWLGSVTLTNTTISGNSTAGNYAIGGGIYAYNGLTAINSTITGNSTAGDGAAGGGIFNTSGAVVLTNSLVLGNVTSYAGLGEDEIHGTVTNNHSIVGGDASLIFAQTAEVLDGNNTATGVFAGVLADNGGPVMTVALRLDASNPALDAGDDSLAPATDARGTVRFDQPGIANLGLNISDLGAFEATEAKSLVVTTLDDVVDDTDGLTSLREAIAFANDATAGDLADGDADNDGNANDTITFDAALSGGTITLEQALGQLVATAALTINGDIDADHAPDITIDAQGHSRVLTTSASTTLQGLEITGGHTSGSGAQGGGVRATGSATVLTVIDSVVSGNSTSGYSADGGGLSSQNTLTLIGSTVTGNSTSDSFADGGGIYAKRDITISNSTINANSTAQAGSNGGGIYSFSGSVTLTNTTVSGNSTMGFDSTGGGIYAFTGVTAINSTITGNSTTGSSAVGGGIFNHNNAVMLTNSLVLGNVTSYAGLATDDISGSISNNYSIVGGDASLIFEQTAEVLDGNGQATGVFAGVLADNGGPVQTIALRADPSNPALDASGAGATTADARGLLVKDLASVANANGNARDLGAFELQFLNSYPAAPTTNTVTTDEDTASAAVTIGASDVDNDTLTYSVKSGAAPTKGSVAFSGDTFTFTPSPNANGADSFTILIEDGQGGSTEQTVSVTINPVNDAPDATNLSAPESYTEDTPLNLVDIVVTDVDSANVTATLTLSNTAAGALSTATSGAVTSTFSAGVWSASGAIADVNALLAGVTFTPAPDFNANLTIATSVSDGIAPALTGTKALTGNAVNDPPLSGNDFLEGTEDEALIIPFADLIYNDSNSDGPQPLTIVSVDNAVNGTAVISGTSVIFTPAAGFTGTASFTYVVSDGGGGYGGAVVEIEVAPAPVIEPPVEGNQPPEVLPDDVTLYTLEGKAIGLHVSASDPDDDPLSFSAGSAAHGMVTGGSGGSFVYTPDAGFLGTDGFVVTVSDGNGGTDTQAVTVEVLDLSGDPDWVLLTTSGFAGEIGGTGAVFGTAGHQDVTILDLAGLVVLDGSFNGGGDIVRLHGNAGDWQVAVEGSMAVFNDGDTLVGIPAGPSGLAILFDDGARELVIDGTMQIGGQSVTEAFAVIGAAPDGTSLPAGGIDPDASAALILMPGAEVAAGGELFVFGTPGAETVTATQGALHFDGSFNGGGDTIAVGEAPGDFTVRLDGSTAVFEGSDTSLAVPIGPAGATLSFGGTDAALLYDADLGAAFIGSQEITMTPAPLGFA